MGEEENVTVAALPWRTRVHDQEERE